MSDLKTEFENAAQDVQKLTKRPDNETLLQLYALYKQGSEGDVVGKRPGITSLKNRAKYDAWNKLQGTPKETAMQNYINIVKRLRESA